jgi:hypothetical protein
MTSHGRCITCKQPLHQRHGFAGTDLCGPCCTGEADTINSVTSTCACGALVEHERWSDPPACFHTQDDNQ